MKKGIQKLVEFLFKCIGSFHSQTIIYFESFHGSQFSDNPRAIYEWMKNHHPEYQYVWGVNKGAEQSFIDEKIPFVRRFSIKWFLTMPRAKAWVINTRTPLWLYKNNKTTYIQTWHGTPLKKIGCDIQTVHIPGYTAESYEKEFSQESCRWDYLIAPNDYASTIFKRAFLYDGPVLEVGYPRNDLLVRTQADTLLKQEIKEKLGVSPYKNVILYAPTWRETAKKQAGKYQFETDFPFEEMTKVVGEDVIILVRMHYLVADSIDFDAYKGAIKDVSKNNDMSELLAITDLLITDYSSCFFDFAITNQPMLFYIPDQKEYEQEMRGVYFPMKEHVPGKLVATKDELVEEVKNWQTNPSTLITKNYQAFKKIYTNLEKGQSAKQVSELIRDEKESYKWEL